MIADGLTMLGTSIHGYQLAPETLLASMDRNDIDRAVIAPVQPPAYDLALQNDWIAGLQSQYAGRLIGFCRVDPRQGAAARSDLQRCVRDLGLRGLFLHPFEEGYKIDGVASIEVLRDAGRLGIPVIVASGYPWVSHASQVAFAAARAPDTTIVMTHGGQINISGLAQADAFTALERTPNLSIGTNGVYRQDFLEECVQRFGAERVLFLSLAPVFDQWFELQRVLAMHIDEEQRGLILGGNLERVL